MRVCVSVKHVQTDSVSFCLTVTIIISSWLSCWPEYRSLLPSFLPKKLLFLTTKIRMIRPSQAFVHFKYLSALIVKWNQLECVVCYSCWSFLPYFRSYNQSVPVQERIIRSSALGTSGPKSFIDSIWSKWNAQ
jgi:hypothetical protein